MGRVQTIVMQASCDDFQSCHIMDQLQDCLIHAQEISAVFFWVIGSPSSELLRDDPTGYLTTQTNGYILTLLRMIPQPVVGVALGCVGRLATNMLRMCDYVIADSCAEFLAGEQWRISAEGAVRIGLAQIVMQRRDLYVQCDSVFNNFQLHSLETSAPIKRELQSMKRQARQKQLHAPLQHVPYGQPPCRLPPPCSDPQACLGASQARSAVSAKAGGPIERAFGTWSSRVAADGQQEMSKESKVEQMRQRWDKTSESSFLSSEVLSTIFEEDDRLATSDVDARSVVQLRE
eukprot:TRINITY_DN94069_c0_g1_i1.p1 TRINITY_DN94069_c0_g1~~TRINITY_DN94069_c0_g1_i1.p1  ORF type:complete len:290 (-),score=44.90 TRINITY_DN94069_c0_g1_i1:121-990(-)